MRTKLPLITILLALGLAQTAAGYCTPIDPIRPTATVDHSDLHVCVTRRGPLLADVHARLHIHLRHARTINLFATGQQLRPLGDVATFPFGNLLTEGDEYGKEDLLAPPGGIVRWWGESYRPSLNHRIHLRRGWSTVRYTTTVSMIAYVNPVVSPAGVVLTPGGIKRAALDSVRLEVGDLDVQDSDWHTRVWRYTLVDPGLIFEAVLSPEGRAASTLVKHRLERPTQYRRLRAHGHFRDVPVPVCSRRLTVSPDLPCAEEPWLGHIA